MITAYIDGANLHKGTESLNWGFDYKRFRVWLKDKYSVEVAYLFIGMIPRNKDLYTRLQEFGYTLVYKEVIYDMKGKAKGNCDADLVVKAMQDSYENNLEKAVLVSSDGDYTPLVKFLLSKRKIEVILSPYDTDKCSVLLKRTDVKISYISEQKSILEVKNEDLKEKAPDVDEPHKGLFRKDV